MSEARFIERQAEVAKAAARLREVAAMPENEIVRDAALQRFEFTFELIWKTLKLYLERQGYETGGPRPTLKKAFAEGIISSTEQGDVWLRMLEDRNLTNHAYDEALAADIYRRVVRDYAPAIARMATAIQSLVWS